MVKKCLHCDRDSVDDYDDTDTDCTYKDVCAVCYWRLKYNKGNNEWVVWVRGQMERLKRLDEWEKIHGKYEMKEGIDG